MNFDSQQVLSLSVSPVILISACCLFALALYNRLAIIISRQRIINRERSQEPSDNYKNIFKINMLKSQSDLIMRRAKMIQKSLLFLNYTILSMILCSFFSGLAYYIIIINYFAIAFFWLALGFFSFAVIFSIKELFLVISTINKEKTFLEEYY